MRAALAISILAAVLAVIGRTAIAADAPRLPVLLDTDLGGAVDDAFALGYLIASGRFELLGVTTCGESAEDRAWIACRFLSSLGMQSVPVAWGREPQPRGPLGGDVIQYRRHPAVVWGRSSKPVAAPAEELLLEKLRARPGATLVALGPLTNVARLLEKHPEAKPLLGSVVFLGGALSIGYSGQPPPEPEWNVRSDMAAARTVFAAGLPLRVAPLEVSVGLKASTAQLAALYLAQNALSLELQTLHQLHGEAEPVLFDLAALRLAHDEAAFELAALRLEVDDRGLTRAVAGEPNARVARTVLRPALLDECLKTLGAHGAPVQLRPLPNPSPQIARRGLPALVHVCEDYETDIERRWWLAGRAELIQESGGQRRVCRGVLTQDFDDRQGEPAARYTAVVFNPVPGPPMRERTRLSFRYLLRGANALRVQIYSLSNGYHRCLTLQGLSAGAWSEATVDMTAARRPDGSGGALAANERIDDIQFYADRRAELWIDDIVLYEEAPEGETRPFPKRAIFSAWFDTGKLGAEWPGDFEIVPHAPPRRWNAARSIVDSASGRPWIRLGLRGARQLAVQTWLRFLYRLEGPAGALEIELFHTASGWSQRQEVAAASGAGWLGAEAFFSVEPLGQGPGESQLADEIRFRAPAGSALFLDDVLLYEPGD